MNATRMRPPIVSASSQPQTLTRTAKVAAVNTADAGPPGVAALLEAVRTISSSLQHDELLEHSLPAISQFAGGPVLMLRGEPLRVLAGCFGDELLHGVQAVTVLAPDLELAERVARSGRIEHGTEVNGTQFIGVPLVCEDAPFGQLQLRLGGATERPTWMILALADAFARALANSERHEQMRAAEQRLWEVIDNTKAVVFVKDLKGRYTLVNRRLEADTGFTQRQLLGKTDFELFPREAAERMHAADRRVLETGEAVEVEGLTEFPTGPRVFSTSKFALRDRNGRIDGLCGVATDITERKQLEAQLRHSQKLDAVGRLASGIAHDFNNMLTGILASAELVGLLLPPGAHSPGIDEALDRIIDASERAAELTRKLIVFSREAHRTAERVDVNGVIEGAVALLRRDIDRHIEIESSLAAATPIVVGDPTRLQAALLDLGLNARDAMLDGGSLKISTRELALDEAGCRNASFSLRPGSYVEITVRDTGVGMSEATVERIFEPFFTTKAVGRGLGLAAVHGTVIEHQGAVTVHSRPGQGTSVVLLLPTVPPTIAETPSISVPMPEESTPERRVVLLVDDEPLLRKTGARMLESLGYRVVVGEDGSEGVIRFQEHHEELALVLLDMVMPKMGGQAAFEAMRAIDDRVPVILCSGYAADAAVRSMLDHGLAGVLNKPYRLVQLTELLERVAVT
jgi:two-component system cell cycle sensor histidine kinase/response regulator CckA